MTEPSQSLKGKRILVTLDTSARGQAALQAAVQLATAVSAELDGVFIEDEDLVRLARLPFAREIDVTSALMRPMAAADIERELRTVADRTQRVFSDALRQLNLAWTFRTMRGTIALTSLAAAGDADLLVIGQRGRSLRQISEDYLPRLASRDLRIVAVFDGSPSAYRAIEMASTLARANSAKLSVLMLSRNDEEPSRQFADWLQQHQILAELDRAPIGTDHGIIDYVRKHPLGMLVINRDSQCLNEKEICDIVNQCDCPVVLC